MLASIHILPLNAHPRYIQITKKLHTNRTTFQISRPTTDDHPRHQSRLRTSSFQEPLPPPLAQYRSFLPSSLYHRKHHILKSSRPLSTATPHPQNSKFTPPTTARARPPPPPYISRPTNPPTDSPHDYAPTNNPSPTPRASSTAPHAPAAVSAAPPPAYSAGARTGTSATVRRRWRVRNSGCALGASASASSTLGSRRVAAPVGG